MQGTQVQSPGLGRFHMPWSNKPRATATEPAAATTEASVLGPCFTREATTMRSRIPDKSSLVHTTSESAHV